MGANNCYNLPNGLSADDDMSEDQLKALWEKTNAHQQAIGSIEGRTLLLEHQAKTHEANMQKMLERADAADAAIRRDIQTMNGTMLQVLQSLSEHKGAKTAMTGFFKTVLPWIVAGLGGAVWLIQVVVK